MKKVIFLPVFFVAMFISKLAYADYDIYTSCREVEGENSTTFYCRVGNSLKTFNIPKESILTSKEGVNGKEVTVFLPNVGEETVFRINKKLISGVKKK